jgi:hypothetical protein
MSPISISGENGGCPVPSLSLTDQIIVTTIEELHYVAHPCLDDEWFLPLVLFFVIMLVVYFWKLSPMEVRALPKERRHDLPGFLLLCLPHGFQCRGLGLKWWGALPHEMNRNQTPLFEIVEIVYSSLVNRRVQFCWDWRQSGMPPSFDKVPLLRPSDIWTKKMHEPWQPKRMEWWLLDLTKVKWKEKKTREKV